MRRLYKVLLGWLLLLMAGAGLALLTWQWTEARKSNVILESNLLETEAQLLSTQKALERLSQNTAAQESQSVEASANTMDAEQARKLVEEMSSLRASHETQLKQMAVLGAVRQKLQLRIGELEAALRSAQEVARKASSPVNEAFVKNLQGQLVDARLKIADLESQLKVSPAAANAPNADAEADQPAAPADVAPAALFEKADALSEQVRLMKRDASAAHYNLGVYLMRSGQYEEAVKEFDYALGFNPADALAHYNMAVLQDVKLDQPKEAVAHYQRYLELLPNAKDAKDVELRMLRAELRLKVDQKRMIPGDIFEKK
ncbi:MAG: tetratricopeptide repeat protein [Candidatus Omnitrophica bacterium]|nr:tetratricopeptide repeat protein [Candidatus Omnitrophota bacterium]